MSNIFISPVFAKETDETLLDKRVNLYLPESTDHLTIYEDEELADELTRVKNNSRAVLLEEIDTKKVSLIEIETSNNEVVQGYINSEVVVDREDMEEEYKVYAEEENKEIPMYIDETLDETLIDLEEGTSVFVNEAELTETKEEYIHVSLNEEIPEELEAELEDNEVVEGFVHVDRLVGLDKEDEFLLERENDAQEDATNDEQDNELSDESETDEDNTTEESNEEKQNEQKTKETEQTYEKEKNQTESPKSDKEIKENNEKKTFTSKIKETNTRRLGHIKSSTTPLYKTIGGDSFQAGEKHTNRVYYVKTQAKYGNETYYLLSTNSKGTNTLGWIKSKDLTNLPHKYLHEKTDIMTIKGHGKGTNMAWGGSKNIVHASMAKFKGEDFHVNMTEKVGNNTWYRGKINGSGRNVWLVYSQVEELKAVESSTNRLGHIKSSTTPLYKTIGGDSFQAGEKHTNRVYYVKTQAKYGNETYYLLSTNSKGTNTLGWVKSKDLTNLSHKYLHEKTDVMTIKGHGKGTNMAWGGSKNIVHASMAKFKGEDFHVNMTEKVGNNTWYRGKINGSGRNVWLNSKQKLKNIITKIDYGLSLNAAVEIQMKRSPFIMNGSHGFVAKSRVNSNLKMKAGSTNVRTMPTTVSNRDNKIIKKLQGGTKIKPIAEVGKWYAIEVGGSRKTAALPQQVEQSLDPDNHLTDEVNKFQFLDLRKRTGLTTNEMNRELRTRGILKGEGKAFREASLKHGVNEMYLIVHARLETGNGTSALSNGTHEVGLDQNGKPQLVEGAADRVRLTNIKKTYNMFGIGAIDSDPARGGAVRAYEEGWFTPHDAIVGGAHWIKDNYIYNQYNQNTIYKMRWNPEMVNGAAWKQYATDIEWAIKQARLIHSVYNKTDQNKVLSFDRPIYK